MNKQATITGITEQVGANLACAADDVAERDRYL